jgi:hypothetical protein
MLLDPASPCSYEYFHYTTEATKALDLNRAYTQTAVNLALHAPNGLWLSIAGTHDWKHYCLKKNRNLENLKSEFQIILKPTAQILILHSIPALELFLKEYAYYPEGIDRQGDNYTLNQSIDWERILNTYQGLAIPIIIPELDNLGLFNKAWPCTSACIWDIHAMEKVERQDQPELAPPPCETPANTLPFY